MCQFVVFQKPNEVTSVQKKHQNDSVEFTRTYATKNSMSYYEANKSEDRKMQYNEYKKQKKLRGKRLNVMLALQRNNI